RPRMPRQLARCRPGRGSGRGPCVCGDRRAPADAGGHREREEGGAAMSGRLTVRDLEGGKIAKVFDVDGTGILIVEKNSLVHQVEPWRDPEGNGPGHLDVSIIPGATSATQIRLAKS